MSDDTIAGHVKHMADVWTSGKGWPQETINKWAMLFRDERPEIFRKAVDDLLLHHSGNRINPKHIQESLEKYRRQFHVGVTASHCERCGEPVAITKGGFEAHMDVCRRLDPDDRANNAKLVRAKWDHRNPKFRE